MTQKLVTWSTVHETKFIGLTLLKEFARPYALLPYIEKTLLQRMKNGCHLPFKNTLWVTFL